MSDTYTATVIGGTTSHSTRLSKDDNQVAGYPAKAGIQAINNTPTQWDNSKNTALSAMRSCLTSWIPAFAGMTNGCFAYYSTRFKRYL